MTTLEKIKALIEEKGMSHARFAKEIGIHPVTLCNQLKGEVSPKTLKLVSQRYGIPLSELLDDDSVRAIKQVPDVSGYIECEGKIVKVKSIDDLITITDNIKRMAENCGA